MNTALTLQWTSAEQGNASLKHDFIPYVKRLLDVGKPVAIRAEELEDEKSDRQRRYFHGVILTEIAQQATAEGGQKFPMKVWKEYFRDTYVGSKRVSFTNPLTGRKSRRLVRVSTEDLSVRRYSELIEKVTAFAVTELNVRFSVPNWESYGTAEHFPPVRRVA